MLYSRYHEEIRHGEGHTVGWRLELLRRPGRDCGKEDGVRCNRDRRRREGKQRVKTTKLLPEAHTQSFVLPASGGAVRTRNENGAASAATSILRTNLTLRSHCSYSASWNAVHNSEATEVASRVPWSIVLTRLSCSASFVVAAGLNVTGKAVKARSILQAVSWINKTK